jgi:hypothetical protein
VVVVNSIKNYIKELYRSGSCLLVITSPGRMRVYLDGEERGEKEYSGEKLDVHEIDYDVAKAFDELGLESEGLETRLGSVWFAYKKEESPAEKREEAYHWVEEKLKENGIEWNKNRIRTLVGLPPKQ